MTPPGWMIINATRYALRRMTYDVQETTQWLIANWDRLDETVTKQIRIDVEAELELDDVATQNGEAIEYVNMEFDRREWEKVRALWEHRAGDEGNEKW